MVKSFFAPSQVEEAVTLKRDKAKSFFLAGGTLLNAGKRTGEVNFISLHKLALHHIEKREGALHIGAMATLQGIADSPLPAENGLGALSESCRALTKNIRNMATLGGAIASNYTRSDIIPVLLAAGARLAVEGTDKKSLSLEEYIPLRASGNQALIREVIIPIPGSCATLRAARFARTSLDLPLVKVAALITLENGHCKTARIAAGGLAPQAARLPELEKFIEGKSCGALAPGDSEALEALTVKTLSPKDDMRATGAFKKALIKALLEDILYESGKEAR
ncbi:MAG: FAD binding domain-containing protein [Candidatus Eremiobacteraeota bacterium]|nr:FAD binding domain-containing protein [Candidatus Eremiobacteraeota bacterium]